MAGVWNPGPGPTEGGDVFNGDAGADTASGLGGQDALFGNGGDDVLDGGADADTLDGGAGADTMIGGAGDDSYFVDSSSDAVIEQPNEGGLDFVRANVSFVLPANVENLTLAESAGSISAAGNDLDNHIIGNGGDNAIDAGGGNDLVWAGLGADDVLGGFGNDEIVGGAGNDSILGQGGDDTIAAGEGDDFAWGGSGADAVIGEAGHDHLFGAAPLFFDFIAREWRPAEEEDFAPDALFGLDGNDVLEGGGGADLLDGGDGNDVLDGGSGADFLDGGDGDDRFVQEFDLTNVDRILGGAGLDVIDYAASAAEVIVNLSGYATVNHVTRVLLATFTSIEGAIGSNYADVLIGDAADNRLVGGAGADWLVGGGGDDWFVQGLESGIDRIFGGTGGADAGIDTIDYAGAAASVTVQLSGYSASGGVTLATFSGIENAVGSSFADALIGNTSDNRITGGGGADWLVGGAGADTFVYHTISDGTGDSIRDFSQAQIDSIDLSAIDANPTTGGDDLFAFSTARHAGVVGEAVVTNFGGSSLVSLYLDADNVADMTIQVVHQNGIVMGASDFVL